MSVLIERKKQSEKEDRMKRNSFISTRKQYECVFDEEIIHGSLALVSFKQ